MGISRCIESLWTFFEKFHAHSFIYQKYTFTQLIGNLFFIRSSCAFFAISKVHGHSLLLRRSWAFFGIFKSSWAFFDEKLMGFLCVP